MKKIVIGVYREEKRAEAKLVDKIELERPGNFLHRPAWKAEVRGLVRRYGEPLNLSVVHSGGPRNCDVVATVKAQAEELGKRRVTRKGGRPVEGPIRTGKTMASKRRGVK